MRENTPAPADLLPCPFCGGEAEMDHYQPFRHYRTGAPLDQVAIYCTVCNAQVSHYPGDLSLSREETAEIVVAEWNRRAAYAEFMAQPPAQMVAGLLIAGTFVGLLCGVLAVSPN